jgi:hypothetical protein
MHTARRHWYGLPLTLSVLLHAVLVGSLVAFSSRCTATPGEGVDTCTTVGPSGLIIQLPLDESEENGSATQPRPGARPDSEPADFVVKVIDPPIPQGAASQPVAAPVVVAPRGGPAGGTPPNASNSAAATGADSPAGGTGSAGGLFGAAPSAKSVVYVLDRSGSMGQQGAYRIACAEVVANLSRWPPSTQFQVVPYNSSAEPLCIDASLGLLPATTDNVQKAEALLAALPPTGWTDHLCGLRRGLLLGPDVLYLVTDADDLNPQDVRTITNLNHGRTVIHTIEMHSRHGPQLTGALAELSANNRGTHRRVLLDD